MSFSRLVQRAARKAAVLPAVGSTALPGAEEKHHQSTADFMDVCDLEQHQIHANM